jgi:hypothetical protein
VGKTDRESTIIQKILPTFLIMQCQLQRSETLCYNPSNIVTGSDLSRRLILRPIHENGGFLTQHDDTLRVLRILRFYEYIPFSGNQISVLRIKYLRASHSLGLMVDSGLSKEVRSIYLNKDANMRKMASCGSGLTKIYHSCQTWGAV